MATEAMIARLVFFASAVYFIMPPGNVFAAATSDSVLLIEETVTAPVTELKSETAVAPPSQGTNRGQESLSGNPLWAIPLSSLSATRDRPLFMPTRRPAALPPPETPIALVPTGDPPPPTAPVETRISLTLIGTVAGDAQGIALFADPGARDVVRLRIGDVVGGWMLHDVRSREVTFRNGAREEILTIHVPNPAAAIAGADFVPNRNGEPE